MPIVSIYTVGSSIFLFLSFWRGICYNLLSQFASFSLADRLLDYVSKNRTDFFASTMPLPKASNSTVQSRLVTANNGYKYVFIYANDIASLNTFVSTKYDFFEDYKIVFLKPLVLNEQIKLGDITYSQTYTQVDVNFYNIDGFSISTNATPFALFNEMYEYQLTFSYAQMRFYDSGRQPIASCEHYLNDYFNWSGMRNVSREMAENETLLLKLGDLKGPFSFSIANVTFRGSTNYNGRAAICPLAFKDCRIDKMEFNDLKESLIQTNVIEFAPPPPLPIIATNSTVERVALFNSFNLNLSARLVDGNLFRRMRLMHVQGSLARIDANAFKSFELLRFVRIRVENLRGLLHSSDNKWLAGLNYWTRAHNYEPELWLLSKHGHTIATYKSSSLRLHLDDSSLTFKYDYPDVDFCLFKHFAHDQLVIPLIEDTLGDEQVTCTLFYLIQYNIFVEESAKMMIIRKNETRSIYLEKCDLGARLSMCNSVLSENGSLSIRDMFDYYQYLQSALLASIYFGYADFVNLGQWLKFICFVIGMPIISAVAFCTNSLTIFGHSQ